MEDKKNILSGIDFMYSSWLEERDSVCNTVLYMYYKISEKFLKDERYGSSFVSANQQLIGQLVQAAMSELQSIQRKETMEEQAKTINDLIESLSSSLGNIAYALEDKKNELWLIL